MKSGLPKTFIPHLSNTKNVFNLKAVKVTNIIFSLNMINHNL